MTMVETARGTVHEWQRDHMGHINVRAYMEFFEEACWQFYAMLGLTASLLRSGVVHLAAVQQDISYIKELYPGDTIVVRTGVLEMREKVLRFRHKLFNTETGAVCAACEFTVVCLNPESRRSQPFPAEVAARAQAFLETTDD
ncbi:MAG TPA: thioesterase family protein [Aromatoleum sp.]|uniref:acyl-CoA thioesterase n=1 Tax=Aromatoleum sp. TaxID=2307007 RepID=UPI002B49B0C7|nr:thioesterase family protein [Aromatoleum sp.]HJV26291.1 thioesterase family protein [Aromatoleum sp.]